MPTDPTPTDERLASLIHRLKITYPWHDHVDAGSEIMRQAWNAMHSNRREAAAALRELRSARARVGELEAESVVLRGAMDAQDQREKEAGERCGVSWIVHGCDWPEWIADELIEVRADRDRLAARVAELEAFIRKGVDVFGLLVDGVVDLTAGDNPMHFWLGQAAAYAPEAAAASKEDE